MNLTISPFGNPWQNYKSTLNVLEYILLKITKKKKKKKQPSLKDLNLGSCCKKKTRNLDLALTCLS